MVLTSSRNLGLELISTKTIKMFHKKIVNFAAIVKIANFKGAVTYYRIALTDAERTEKNAKNVYPVEKFVSMAMKVVAEGVRSA